MESSQTYINTEPRLISEWPKILLAHNPAPSSVENLRKTITIQVRTHSISPTSYTKSSIWFSSTTEQIHRVYNHIHQSLEEKNCSAAFLGISQEFDRIWHRGLLYISVRSFHIHISPYFSPTNKIYITL